MDGAAPVAVKAAPSPKSPPKYPDLCGRRRLQLEVQILNREIGFLEEELQSLEGLQPVSRCCKEVEEFVGSKADPFLPIDKKRRRSCHLWKWLRSVFCFPASLLCCSCCQKSTCCSCCSPPKDCCCFNRKCHCPRCCLCKCPRLHCNHAVCPRCSSCPCFQSCCNITAPPCCDSCSCSCFHLPSCRIPRCCSCPCDCDFSCRLPDCCCCCPLEISCCRMPQCLACDLSFCMPWKWRCCCCFQEISCSLPRPSCPEYSCGCIWSCPKCTEARLCGSCCTSKSSCITGCLC